MIRISIGSSILPYQPSPLFLLVHEHDRLTRNFSALRYVSDYLIVSLVAPAAIGNTADAHGAAITSRVRAHRYILG